MRAIYQIIYDNVNRKDRKKEKKYCKNTRDIKTFVVLGKQKGAKEKRPHNQQSTKNHQFQSRNLTPFSFAYLK